MLLLLPEECLLTLTPSVVILFNYSSHVHHLQYKRLLTALKWQILCQGDKVSIICVWILLFWNQTEGIGKESGCQDLLNCDLLIKLAVLNSWVSLQSVECTFWERTFLSLFLVETFNTPSALWTEIKKISNVCMEDYFKTFSSVRLNTIMEK